MNRSDKGIEEFSDNKLISNIKLKGCNDSYLEISKRYENVFYRICHRYKLALQSVGLDPCDVLEDKDVVFLTCIHKFNPRKKTKFSTWAGNYARYLCLTAINKHKKFVDNEEDGVKGFIEDSGQLDVFQAKDAEPYENVLFHFNELSNKRFKTVLRLRYYSDMPKTWKEIASEMDVSVQTAISLHNKALSTLKNKIKSKNHL